MIRLLSTLIVIGSAAFLTGCGDDSSRLGGSLFSSQPATRPVTSSNAPAPISATPTPVVTSQPLPPPPPRFAPAVNIPAVNPAPVANPVAVVQPPSLSAPIPGGVVAPSAGGLSGSSIPETKLATAPVVAAAPTLRKAAPVQTEAAPEKTSPEKPSQSRLTGSWAVAQGSGAKCRLTLSNSPALDLYKAQTSNCGAGLTKVNAWELQGNEIYLYAQGGGVAARLKQTGNTSFSGSVAASGAPVSISK